tara:strand:- start:2662 stop:3321 length:660 start_codon:yes stop_codon:yes gene_type:complete
LRFDNLNSFSENKLILENNINFSNRINQRRIAIFMDRDGVIIKDMHYLSDPERVILELGIKNLMQFAFDNFIPVFVVTNQSGIARKKFSWHDYFNVTNRMLEIIGSPNPIVGIYSNSYLETINNNWRKPNPGMILNAANQFKINLKESFLIGDRITDLQAGVNAGIGNVVHLLTGHGLKEREGVKKSIMQNKLFFLNKKSSMIYLLDNLLQFPSYLKKH